MRLKLLFLLFFSLQNVTNSAEICGKPTKSSLPQAFILGGTEVRPKFLYEWLVNLRMKSDTEVIFCGGSLIEEDAVLTAVHCVLSRNNSILSPDEIWVFAMTHNASKAEENGLRVGVREILVHNNFSFAHLEDNVAILRLEKPLKNLMPICLPCPPNSVQYASEIATNAYCRAVGWGLREEQSSHNNDTGIMYLRRAEVPRQIKLRILPRERCELHWPSGNSALSPFQLCAGRRRARNICAGDSGGPLMCHDPQTNHWFVIGINSGGSMVCATKPALFTDTIATAAWIRDTLNKMGYAKHTCHMVVQPRGCYSSSAVHNSQFSQKFLASHEHFPDFERVNNLFFNGEQIQMSLAKMSWASRKFNEFRSLRDCTNWCCSIGVCQSAVYYGKHGECYLFKNRYCDANVSNTMTKWNYTDEQVIYIGKKHC